VAPLAATYSRECVEWEFCEVPWWARPGRLPGRGAGYITFNTNITLLGEARCALWVHHALRGKGNPAHALLCVGGRKEEQ
jgi:hypothetical protein